MKRERLTPERIRNFTCPEGAKQSFLWDTQARLAVRATAGAKSFIFESKLDRQTIRVTIGSVDAWPLDDVFDKATKAVVQRGARSEARKLQTLIDQRIDPRELVREQEAAKRAAKEAAQAAAEAKRAAVEAARAEAERQSRYTLRALCDAYVRSLDRAGKAKSAASVRSAFKCHVETQPEIAGTLARDVTDEQIAMLVRMVREAGKERAAGTLRSYLSAAFGQAKRARLDASLPADLIPFGVKQNPVVDVPAIAVGKGDRTLSAAEVRVYIGHLLRIGQETGPELADMALLLALYAGGQRMAQLLRAKVSDYDPDTATLKLLDGKGKRAKPREHLLPLAPRAAAMVEYLCARAKRLDGEQWLFASWKDTRMSDETPGKRASEISKAMGGEGFDLRDVRRTVETMLAGLRISKDTRAQLLSHGIGGVQDAHYDRHSYADEKHAALLAWEARLSEIARAERAPSNVVRLGQRAA